MKNIEYLVKERVGYITLNRPEKRNALSFDLVTELKQAFTQAEQDDSVKVVVLKARGEAFCAGADLAYLKQLQNFSYEENLADSTHLKELFQQIYTLKKVVVAQVQGHALAGGCGLAAICDFSFTVPEAKFGYTEVKIGFVPAIVTIFLVRKIGEARARHLLLSGDLITAQEAYATGLVSKVCTRETLEAEGSIFVQKLITENSANSMMLTKQMMATLPLADVDKSLTYAAEVNAKARESEDCKRGIAAFLNKEKITW